MSAVVRSFVGSVIAFWVLAGALFTTEVARADCIGPTYTNTGGDLAHGDLVTVTGYGFGDNCYDTGPPPPGEGDLGRPLTGIEVYFEQRGQLHLVATGNAGEDYAWEIQVPLPAVLDVGDVGVVVTSNGRDAFHENPGEIWATSDAAGNAAIEPVTFGPPGSRQTGFQGTNWTPLITLIAVSGLIATGILIQRRATS